MLDRGELVVGLPPVGVAVVAELSEGVRVVGGEHFAGRDPELGERPQKIGEPFVVGAGVRSGRQRRSDPGCCQVLGVAFPFGSAASAGASNGLTAWSAGPSFSTCSCWAASLC